MGESNPVLVCVLILCANLCLNNSVSAQDTTYVRRFPPDFIWGVGTSSYQIEGGWNEGGKGESIWDHLVHNHPEKILDQSAADVSADSFHHSRRDVEMVRELGVNIYRFSLSWPRILPTGFVNHINQPGIDYYNGLIDELLHYNITPMVTMYHWDLPQRIQELGGWTNPEIINYFMDYAKVLFDNFGDRIKIWTTINEPWHVCEQAYGIDFMAPALNFPGIPSYLCGHNLLKAHAEVVHMYRKRYQRDQKGRIGITTDISWPEPKTDSEENQMASEMALQFYLGWFAHPIFSKTGNYPQKMIDRIDNLSKQQGFPRSRLPKFTQQEIDRIRGTSDFFGINSYTSVLVERNDRYNSANHPVPSFNHDMGNVESIDPEWKRSSSVWLYVVPRGMYKLLHWIRSEYDNPPVIITENGVSDNSGTNDVDRVFYFNSYLEAILDAIEDGCNVQGYIAWSLMDSYEWKDGFSVRFGLYHVDFTHPNKTRTAKMSAKVYANIIETNTIDWEFKPQPDVIIAEAQVGSGSWSNAGNLITTVLVVTLCSLLAKIRLSM